MQMNLFRTFKDKNSREIMPGFHGKFEHSEKATLAFWEIDEEAELPSHNHPHEQIATVYKGRFELTIDGETRILEPGMVATIPSNAIHSGRAITDCEITDVFVPVREDYIFD